MSTPVDKFFIEYTEETVQEKRFEILLGFVDTYYDSSRSEVNQVLEKELEFFTKNNNINGQVLTRLILAFSCLQRGELEKGNEEIQKVMTVFDKAESHLVRAHVFYLLAHTHAQQGNYEPAFKYVYESIRESELAPKNKHQFLGLYTLGMFHFDLKDYANAEKCFVEAARGFTDNGNKYGLARSETGLSSVYIQQEKFTEAEKLLQRSLAYYEQLEVVSGQSRSLNDLGLIYRRTSQLEKALDCFRQALELRKQTNHEQGIATSLNDIADLLLSLKKFEEAGKYLHEAKLACEKVNNRSKLYRTHFLFSQLYRNTNQPWQALEHYELFDKLKTEVQGETANNKIKELQTRMATEKSEKEAEIERLKNVELKSAYDTIELRNKEITDSIHYAQRIQKALLAPDELLKRNLNNFFVLYKPKDIVSGDFYWATEKGNRFYFAVCDSTGHGVPGAFMSLLNISFLNEAITEKGISRPNEVLNHVRQKLIENISSEGAQDGMDGMLFCFDKHKLSYAAANNSPFVVRDGMLAELESDKMPVGLGERKDSFRHFEIDVKKGDTLYLITDGYADQFGGPKGKKFKYKNLVELLNQIRLLPLEEQKQKLIATLKEWKGDLEQVDDILVIGIRM